MTWNDYKNPLWQQMRLKVMERDNWTCRACKSTTKPLNVHHTYYAKGRSPWEYELESLKTLCEDCHEMTSETLKEIRRTVGAADQATLERILGLLRVAAYSEGQRTMRVETDEVLNGAHSVWSQAPEHIQRCVHSGELQLSRYFQEFATYNHHPAIRSNAFGVFLVDDKIHVEGASDALRDEIMARQESIVALLDEITRLRHDDFHRTYAAEKAAGAAEPDTSSEPF